MKISTYGLLADSPRTVAISLRIWLMSSANRRLDKLESNLTPKQAMLHWMSGAHSFQTLEEYAAHMKGQPDNAWPLGRLGDQMKAAAEQSLKGRPKEEINRALRQTLLDALFLFFLHQQSNGR